MRSIFVLVVSMQLVAFAAPAQEHDHLAMLRAFIAANSSHGQVFPQPDTVNPAAAKAFNMVARSFSFTVTPSPFVVNQGDIVTITFSVPSNDEAAAHGLLMETYVEGGVDVNKGKSQQITFTATTAGTFAFVCDVPSCGIGHSNMFGNFIVNAVVAQPPQVASVNPATGPTTGGTAVTISGANFQSNATVKFGGVAATSVNVGTSTSISATTPAHATGAVDVVVTNPDAKSGTLAAGFTYALPLPTITSITPGTGPTSGNTFVTINGTNFDSGATVTVGDVAASDVTVVNATTITALTPLGPANEQLGAKDVVVTNPSTTKATLAQAFQYTRPPLSIALITPSAALPAGGSAIAISGAGFTSALASSLTIGGIAATNVQVIDAVTMTASVPAHAVGPVSVVLTVGGTSVTANGFAYISAFPKHRGVKH